MVQVTGYVAIHFLWSIWLYNFGWDYITCGEPGPTAMRRIIISTTHHPSVTCTCEIASLDESTVQRNLNEWWWWGTLPPQWRVTMNHRFVGWSVNWFRQYPLLSLMCNLWGDLVWTISHSNWNISQQCKVYYHLCTYVKGTEWNMGPFSEHFIGSIYCVNDYTTRTAPSHFCL